MEALLALAPPALLSAAPLPAPAAAAGVAAPVAVAPHAAAAPKRRHCQTHGAGPGASMEKMAMLRCIKENKRMRLELEQRERSGEDPNSVQGQLDLSFIRIGEMMCSWRTLESMLHVDRRTTVDKLQVHLAVLFTSERCAVLNIMKHSLMSPELLDAKEMSHDDFRAVLSETPVDITEIKLPKLADHRAADHKVPSHFAESFEHDETKSVARIFQDGKDQINN